MIVNFEKVGWKNFLSTGNTMTWVTLNSAKLTLIVGTNGAGKSTLLDAICYALYGKAFRNITIPQLVNTINQKESLVEIHFSIGSRKYRVIRGQKPTIFEIYCDGNLIPQNADARSYQRHLESAILRMNFKSFTQIVTLGVSSFVPFMDLETGKRRELIDDLLDIQIFTTMGNILKARSTINKEQIEENKNRTNLLLQRIELHKKHLEEMKSNTEEQIKQHEESITSYKAKLEAAQQSVRQKATEARTLEARLTGREANRKKLDESNKLYRKLDTKMDEHNRVIEFFTKNDNCPTCQQVIESGFKQTVVDDKQAVINTYTTAQTGLRTKIDELMKLESGYVEVETAMLAIERLQRDYQYEVNLNNKLISTIESEIKKLLAVSKEQSVKSDDIIEAQNKLIEETSIKEALLLQRDVYDTTNQLLKDGGIKAEVVKQFVPVINKLINKYLAALDFFVNFEFDENFKESIKSRHRDDFSYHSFSEGEKLRIDLSLLFTWRAIAKLRSSMGTNLLIMDEIFESSLDNNGTDEFLKLLDNFIDDTNIFVISHKGDQLFDKFDSVLKFEKHQNFSKVIQ